MNLDIKIRTLIGPAIKTYIPSIVKIRQQVLDEIPYLKSIGSEQNLKYIRYLSQIKDAIAVLIFDGPKIIGVSTGAPLADEISFVQQPFIKRGLPVEEYYYFGRAALLKPYRSRGMFHHFFKLREEHVCRLKRFSKICLTSITPPKGMSKHPDQVELETFCKKWGYVEHAEINCKDTFPDTSLVVSFNFWIKPVPTTPLPTNSAELNELEESLEAIFE